MEITKMTVKSLSDAIISREISSVEATRAYLDRIEEKDSDIGAYLTVTAEKALNDAEKVDRKLLSGEKLSPLAGIPAGIKDNMCTKGTLTTCASKMLHNFVPPYDATVIEKLKSNDFVMLGKLNMDEFAMGSTTENSYFKKTRNPRDLSRVPGGSSGGSAACVAGELAAYSLGSDTGGSIRQPAAFCGIVGMKPTYGTVSRYGLVAFASSLDQIGPMTKDVYDCAMVLDAITGYDKHDSTSLDIEYKSCLDGINCGVRGMKIGLPKEYFGKGISPAVSDAIMTAAKKYESMGAHIIETSLPSLSAALPAYYVISSAEASSNLARFDGVKYGYRSESFTDIESLHRNTRSEGFGAEVKRRIMLGTFVLSEGYYDAYYKKALQVRTLIMRDFEKIFEQCDMILSPVAPTVSYKIGEKTGDPLEMYMGDIYTVPVNIAGIPALSMPCGIDPSTGMPIGMQLIGPAFSEAKLCRAGYAFEREV